MVAVKGEQMALCRANTRVKTLLHNTPAIYFITYRQLNAILCGKKKVHLY